jgi:hypothetical protein
LTTIGPTGDRRSAPPETYSIQASLSGIIARLRADSPGCTAGGVCM